MEWRSGIKAWLGVLLLLGVVLVSSGRAAPIPQGDTQVSPLPELNVKLGIQYRVMYNASNIPGPGGTTLTDPKGYDFFRQRLRLNVELQPVEQAGGFAQLEFRGGWGGTAPDFSDPRDSEPTLNPFNRLQARGVRYGYLYVTPADGHTLMAGILPTSDQVGDTLFSADWDFNVGGVMYLGKTGPLEYRLAYLRPVETVNSEFQEDLWKDGHLAIGDLNIAFDAVKVGLHVYYLRIGQVEDPGAAPALRAGRTHEGWYGLTASGSLGPVALNGFVMVNTGRFFGSARHTGYAVKAEGSLPLGPVTGSLLFLFTTGDQDPTKPEDRFVTLQELVGTQGYWAYTHLFTANGPSDVNDLGLRIDNKGSGLWTVQGKLSAPLFKRVRGDLIVGWFQAEEKHPVTHASYLGTEVAGMLTLDVAKHMVLQVGAAGALLGDFLAQDAEDLFEVFSRFQLQF